MLPKITFGFWIRLVLLNRVNYIAASLPVLREQGPLDTYYEVSFS